jgi:hypothetical protein
MPLSARNGKVFAATIGRPTVDIVMINTVGALIQTNEKRFGKWGALPTV